MDILNSPAELHAWRAAHPGTLGLVPTMGYLHEGHLSLARAAREENELAVATIFVNPTQFGPNEDFERYPRNEAGDLAALEAAGMDAVYLPTPAVMYPEGYQTYVVVEAVTQALEGAARPGHFRGVTTVVLKLFNAAQPTRAYFGRKDAQQLRVIRRMIKDLDLALEIVPCAIVREPDGLAMSSRNVYLTPEQRKAAPVIRQALLAAAVRWSRGTRDATAIRDTALGVLATQPLGQVEYVSLADDETLEELQGKVTRPALLSTVVRFGATRLLDNLELE